MPIARSELFARREVVKAAWLIAIILVSTIVAMIVSWRAPGLGFYAQDRLIQARGPITPPDDIALVVIDESSIARYGRFPWARSLEAQVIDRLAAAQPKAIGVDILFSEPTVAADDAALADAITRAGNVILAAQLTEMTDQNGVQTSGWLRPIPLIENAAAGVGHTNVSTEASGTRELSLRKADDQGHGLWSIAVETIRVGEGVRPTSVRDVPDAVILGAHKIPVEPELPSAQLSSKEPDKPLEAIRSDQMRIDFIGPPGSFSHQSFSFTDVLDGRVSPQSFRGKFVLIGATAATLGDRIATPFVHTDGPGAEQHGELMPGVEILGNAINTILGGRFYRETPDWLAAFVSALVAASVLGLFALAQGKFEGIKQIGVLIGLLGLILVASYLVFVHLLIVPPLVPALISFVVAAPLGLLRRSLEASTNLDTRITELTSASELDIFSTMRHSSDVKANVANLIANLTGSSAVAIYAETKPDSGLYRIVASSGTNFSPTIQENQVLVAVSGLNVLADQQGTAASANNAPNDSKPAERERVLRIGSRGPRRGVLVLREMSENTRTETVRLAEELAASCIAGGGSTAAEVSAPSLLPRGVEWKARALGVLNRRLLSRARFVSRSLRAVEDGLVVTDITGLITFANLRAVAIFGVPEPALVGSNLFKRLLELEGQTKPDDPQINRIARGVLTQAVVGRAPFDREIATGATPQRFYTARISTVTSSDDGTGAIIGLVAALSDVTQQHELQEMKSDVMTLVTHELITPLTAIQGMSEVLAQFEVHEERRREMHLAINDEAKRLSQMIRGYLDITRLESGAHPLHLDPVRLVHLIDRVLLLLGPVAAQRDIQIVKQVTPDLPTIMADADLLAQALTNLIANAIKYSPIETEITVTARAVDDAILIEVRDEGYGISAEALPRIFEKFYRVPSVKDSDTPGIGLGLSLVREIVELHGGRVTVQSQPGVGSTFLVRLPIGVNRRK